MERRKLTYIALVLSIVYGGLFAVLPDGDKSAYAGIGAIVVAIAWISVGLLGRDESGGSDK